VKKEYEAPEINVEEFELDNSIGNLCSGISPIPEIWSGKIE